MRPRSAYESGRAEGRDSSNFITNLAKDLQTGVRETGLTAYKETTEGISLEAQEAALNILTRLSGILSTKLTNTHLAVVRAGGIGLLYYKFYLTVFDLRTGKPVKGLKKRRIQSSGNATAVYLSDTYAASYFSRGILSPQVYAGIINLSTSEELQIDIPLMPIGEDNVMLTNTQFSSTYMYGGEHYLNMVDLSGQHPVIRFNNVTCPSQPILRPDYVAVGGSGIITLYDPHTGSVRIGLPVNDTWLAGDRFVVAHSYGQVLPEEENRLTIYDTVTEKTAIIDTPFLKKHCVELMVTDNYLIIGPDNIEQLVRQTEKDLFSSIDHLVAGKIPISETSHVVIDLLTGSLFRADCYSITEAANHFIVHQSSDRIMGAANRLVVRQPSSCQTIVCDKRTMLPIPGLSAVKGLAYKDDIANSHIVIEGKGKITIYNMHTGTALLSLASDIRYELIPGIGQKDYIWLMGWGPTSINCALLLDGDIITFLYPNARDFRKTGLLIDILPTLPLPQSGPLRIEGYTAQAIEDQI